MVDPVSGSGGIPPVKNVNKTVAKLSEAEKVQSADAVEISDDALALAQAAEVKAQVANDPAAVLSNNSESFKEFL